MKTYPTCHLCSPPSTSQFLSCQCQLVRQVENWQVKKDNHSHFTSHIVKYQRGNKKNKLGQWRILCQWDLLSKVNDHVTRRKIRLIEGNAKCCHLKRLTCKGTLRQVFICLRPKTPYPPPLLHNVYEYTVYLFKAGRGGSWTIEKVGGVTVYKAGLKIPTWLTISPAYKTPINTCRKVPFQVKFFR